MIFVGVLLPRSFLGNRVVGTVKRPDLADDELKCRELPFIILFYGSDTQPQVDLMRRVSWMT
jgi:hypothetical protein